MTVQGHLGFRKQQITIVTKIFPLQIMNRMVSSPRHLSSIAMEFRKVSHVIFDMDGLLLDTETLYTASTQKVLDPYDKTYTWDVKATLMGLHHKEVAEKIIEIYNLPLTWEEYSVLQRKYAIEIMGNAQLQPDTEPIYENTVGQIAKSFGKSYPYETRMRIMGTTEDLTAKIAVTELGLPLTPEQFLEKFHAMCRRRLGDAQLLKGADRLLRHLHNTKVPFCLATSSADHMVEIKTKNHKELFNLFTHKVCGSTDPEVKHGKPAPDIFMVAASRFPDKPSADKCLVFEDAPNGVTAARAAGMQVVMVPDSHVPVEMYKGATQVLKSLEEFKPEDFGLPPFPE